MACVRFSCLVALASICSAAGAQPAKLCVQVDKPGVKISPMLYGIFFEEINMAGDGGLYAELVRNRSFEDSDQPEHWSLVTDGSRQGAMAIDTERPLNPQSKRSLRLKIAAAGEGRVGVASAGFWGIPLVKDAAYELSFSARSADGFAGPVVVMLQSADGKQVYAQAEVSGVTSDWKTFRASLVAKQTDPQARLVLAAARPGTLWLDMVSLFPRKTWKDRPGGLRPDLAQMLAGLNPAFVRFPGGCWVEGDTLEFAQRWKQTIGDVALRRNQWNIWRYYSTNGLGFHEYLQMCEDLGAEPLFVINCGMSHKEVVPLDQMGPWVQDALDAIEYANGPSESPWRALRAKAGHPRPFGLKYLEIGNENGGPPYGERYPLFYDAIKAKYPRMHLVADHWIGKPQTQRIEIVDEHYYNSPEFFIAQANRYDNYDRNGPKVYVGEYAVTHNCGKGNLRGAVGEAAFMTGMERNSDVVIMASYAPLFANLNLKHWNPDLINFDNTRVFGTPSYYVQKMFSAHRGDVVLPLAVDSPLVDAGTTGGAIGVGTWATQAEFKEIRVTQGDQLLYQADFSKGLAGWKRNQHGKWETADGALRQTSNEIDVRATAGQKSWDHYTYSLKARKLGGAEGFLILFAVQNEHAKSWWNLGGWGNHRHAVEMNGIVGNEVPGRIETGRWYDIRIEVQGHSIRCYLDGKLLHDIHTPKLHALYATASRVTASGEVIVKAVNVADAPQETEISLAGMPGAARAATVTVLTSADPDDENTLEQPAKVTPQTTTIPLSGPIFRHSFPAHSVTVLRVGP